MAVFRPCSTPNRVKAMTTWAKMRKVRPRLRQIPAHTSGRYFTSLVPPFPAVPEPQVVLYLGHKAFIDASRLGALRLFPPHGLYSGDWFERCPVVCSATPVANVGAPRSHLRSPSARHSAS